ncbi:MAG: hypothetical protein AAF907_06120, partial [Planctomycetota bacterium]
RDAIQRVESTPEAAPSDVAVIWYALATALRQSGRARPSQEAWQNAMDRDPRFANTQEAVGMRAYVAALDAFEARGWAPTGEAPPPGFELLVAQDGGAPAPVMLAEPTPDGGFLLSVEELDRLKAAENAWIAVSNDRATTLHRASEALRRGPQPVRFRIPPETPPVSPTAGDPATGPTPAPSPQPIGD